MWLSLKRGGTFQKCDSKMCTTPRREAQNENDQFGSSVSPLRNAHFLEANFGKCTALKRNASKKEPGRNGRLGVINLLIL